MKRSKADEEKYIARCMAQPVLTKPLGDYTRAPMSSVCTIQHDRRSLRDRLYDEACIAAAELVGPNSPEYDDCVERRFEELLLEYRVE